MSKGQISNIFQLSICDENLHFLAPTRATATTTTNCGNYNNNNNDNTYKYNMPFQFLVCEVLNLIIVVGNIYLTDFFLGFNAGTWLRVRISEIVRAAERWLGEEALAVADAPLVLAAVAAA